MRIWVGLVVVSCLQVACADGPGVSEGPGMVEDATSEPDAVDDVIEEVEEAEPDISEDDPPPDFSTIGPRSSLADGFHVTPTLPEQGEAFSMIVASDPQLWWNFIDGVQGASDEAVEAQNQRHIDAMNTLIAGEDLPMGFPAPIGVIMNGDLTEYGRWIQWDAYYRLYEQVQAPIWDGLGNHEYENNNTFVSNGCAAQVTDAQAWFEACDAGSDRTLWGEPACEVYQHMVDDLWGWCATDAMRRTRHWLQTHAAHLHDHDPGSGAYSWEMGNIHFVQLHNDPMYEVPETTICNAIAWMKRDLKSAFDRGMKIVLNMHKPINGRLKPHLEGYEYNIVAIFYGHHHGNVGHTGSYTLRGVEIPRFYGGSVEWNLFSLARFGPESFTVVSIDSNTGRPVHHDTSEAYDNVGRAAVAAPFTAPYPTHACPLGQIPDGVDGPCVVPVLEAPPTEDCTLGTD